MSLIAAQKNDSEVVFIHYMLMLTTQFTDCILNG